MDPALQSMIANLQKNTGRNLEQWFDVLAASGSEKHTDLMTHLKVEHGVSHGFANQLALLFRERGETHTDDDLVDAQYAGAKRPLRPLYDAIISSISEFGPDVAITPKRTGVSLRRHKQFALIEAPSSKRLQLGINLKDDPGTDRLLVAGGMCTHKVSVSSSEEIDSELLGWLRRAYDAG